MINVYLLPQNMPHCSNDKSLNCNIDFVSSLSTKYFTGTDNPKKHNELKLISCALTNLYSLVLSFGSATPAGQRQSSLGTATWLARSFNASTERADESAAKTITITVQTNAAERTLNHNASNKCYLSTPEIIILPRLHSPDTHMHTQNVLDILIFYKILLGTFMCMFTCIKYETLVVKRQMGCLIHHCTACLFGIIINIYLTKADSRK